MTQDQRSSARDQAPPPDDDRKPDSPSQLHGRSWRHAVRSAVREFGEDQCTDVAAALTYYSVLALFPALLALVSILGLVGRSGEVVDTLLGIVRDVAPGGAADALAPVLQGLTDAPAAGLALVTGLAGALWSASGYVGGVRPGDEPGLRDRRGPAVLEAAPGDAPGDAGRVLVVALVAGRRSS